MKTPLDRLYDQTSTRAREAWASAADSGETRTEARYDRDKFALATGIMPPVSAPVRDLLLELHALAQGDTLADSMPLNGLHFTFLAISGPVYAQPARPAHYASLAAAFQAITPHQVTIRNLRLVALADQILLAGIPDELSLRRRQTLTDRLLSGEWQDPLKKRYGNLPLPPPFWHSTLLRYETTRLPLPFRAFFERHCGRDLGEVSAPLALAMVNYNWTTVTVLEGGMPGR